jgi:hypothetical protein
MRKWAVAAALFTLAGSTLPSAALAAMPGPDSAPECEVAESPVITIKFENVFLLAWDPESAETPPVDTNVSAGQYQVTAISYDDHSDKPGQVQEREQWKLRLSTTSGDVVAESTATEDIPDDTDLHSSELATLDVSEDAQVAVAFHAFNPGSGWESVVPMCVYLYPVGDDSLAPPAEGAVTPPAPPPAEGAVTPPAPAPEEGAVTPPAPAPEEGAVTPPAEGAVTPPAPAPEEGAVTPPAEGAVTPPAPAPEEGAVTPPAQGAVTPPGLGSGGEAQEDGETEVLAETLQQLPLTGTNGEVLMAAVLVLSLGLFLVYRARDWQRRLVRRAARIWRRRIP